MARVKPKRKVVKRKPPPRRKPVARKTPRRNPNARPYEGAQFDPGMQPRSAGARQREYQPIIDYANAPDPYASVSFTPDERAQQAQGYMGAWTNPALAGLAGMSGRYQGRLLASARNTALGAGWMTDPEGPVMLRPKQAGIFADLSQHDPGRAEMAALYGRTPANTSALFGRMQTDDSNRAGLRLRQRNDVGDLWSGLYRAGQSDELGRSKGRQGFVQNLLGVATRDRQHLESLGQRAGYQAGQLNLGAQRVAVSAGRAATSRRQGAARLAETMRHNNVGEALAAAKEQRMGRGGVEPSSSITKLHNDGRVYDKNGKVIPGQTYNPKKTATAAGGKKGSGGAVSRATTLVQKAVSSGVKNNLVAAQVRRRARADVAAILGPYMTPKQIDAFVDRLLVARYGPKRGWAKPGAKRAAPKGKTAGGLAAASATASK